MHPDRLAYVDDPAVAVARLRRHRQEVTRAAERAGADVLEGRRSGIAGDAWIPQVLLIAPTDDAPTDDDGRDMAADDAAGTRGPGVDGPAGSLARELAAAATRSAVALVVAGSDGNPHVPAGRWQLRIDRDGVLTVPALGVSLIAQQIPAAEAAQLAQLLAFAADPTPTPAGGEAAPAARTPDRSAAENGAAVGTDTPTDTATDTAPGRTIEGETVRTPRPGSVLDGPDRTYLAAAATTEADLQVLAPAVPPQVRERIEAADDDLDRDLAAWHDPADPRPKITVLGGPVVRAG
jgi:hypothetical protein